MRFVAIVQQIERSVQNVSDSKWEVKTKMEGDEKGKTGAGDRLDGK